MMWNVTTVVEREVRADTEAEAIEIAEKLVLAMPTLDARSCPTDPDVYSQADECEELGPSPRQREIAKDWPLPEDVKTYLSNYAGEPIRVVEDVDEPHPDLVDVPDVDTELDAKAALHQIPAEDGASLSDVPGDALPPTPDSESRASQEKVLDDDDCCVTCGEHFADPHAPDCPRDVEPEGSDDE